MLTEWNLKSWVALNNVQCSINIMNILGSVDHINGIPCLDGVPSWTYLRNVAFGEEKHRSEDGGRGNCEVCRLYLWGIAVLYMWGMQVISAQKYLAHMSSLADNPNIRFQDEIGAFWCCHHNSRNVNAGNYISIEICVMLGHVVAQGGQNMQFTLTWMHPRGAHSVSAHSTGIICRRMAHIFISTYVCKHC